MKSVSSSRQRKNSRLESTEIGPLQFDPGRFAAESFANISMLARKSRPFVLTAWSFGVAIFASYMMLGASTVRRMRREAEPALPETRAMCEALARRLGITCVPSVLVHRRVGEPFLCGIVRPAIILPGPWLTTGRGDSLQAILAHELAHAKRMDHLVNLAQRTVEMMLFFHPAIHWLSRSLRRQREFWRDALAVRLTGNPLALATALESVARLSVSLSPAPLGASTLGGQSTSLLPRIKELLGMKPSRARPGIWPFAAVPAAGLVALFATSAGLASDHPTGAASGPAVTLRPHPTQENQPLISFEVRYLSLDAQPWRDLATNRLKLVQQDADVCVWIIDDEAMFDLLTDAQKNVTSNVLQAPKAVATENSTVTLDNTSKQFYVAQVERVANGVGVAFRPTVKELDIGVRMELSGTLLERGTKVCLNLQARDLLAMHTLRRSEPVGNAVLSAEYQVPTAVEKRCRVACEIPDGQSVIISLGLHDRRGRSSNAAETANELLQLAGLPPLPARSVACEQLVSIKTRRVLPTGGAKKPSKPRSARIKPESASQPSPARP